MTITHDSNQTEIRSESTGSTIRVERPRKRYNGEIFPASFSCSTFSSADADHTAEWIAMLSAAIELCNEWNEILPATADGPNAAAVRSPKSIEHALKRYQEEWDNIPALQRRIKQLKETKPAVV